MSGPLNTGYPFNLTERQAEVADAIIKYGCTKRAARELGISYRTVQGTLDTVRQKMDAPNQVRMAVEWDRARRTA
jgi:DNA-binding CsgD family transcriptional regulator